MKALLKVGLTAVGFLVAGAAWAGERETAMRVPVLSVNSDGGILDYLPFRYERTDTGKPLRVFIADDTPNGSREGARGSVWLAAMTAAMLRNDPLDGVRLTIEFSGDVDGPSAGGVLCLSILSALDGRPFPADFAMTGTIMPDGTIGLVGGVASKIRAAANKGVKRICVPAFCRFERQEDGTYADLFRMCEDVGVRIHPVKTVQEAYAVAHREPGTRVITYNESEVLSLPVELDAVLLRECMSYFGNKGRVLGDREYWNEVGVKTDFPFWVDDLYREKAYWEVFVQGKMLAALNEATAFRSQYGDYRQFDILGAYRWTMTNEFAVTKEVVVGTNRWAAVADGPYDEKTRKRMADWHASTLTAVTEISRILEELVKSRNEGEDGRLGYFPDAGTTEIAVQGENMEENICEAYGYARYYNAILSARKEPSEMDDDELRASIVDVMRIVALLRRFCCGLDSSLSVSNRCMIYRTLPGRRAGSRVAQCENAFYSAALAVARNIEYDRQDEADEENVAKAVLVQYIDRCDAQYAILRAGIASIQQGHADWTTRRDRLANPRYHVCAQLYRNSQVLAKACTLQVKFSPDVAYDFKEDEIGNREFVHFLSRMARLSALQSIMDCRKAGIPCIDPILRVELGDVALGATDSDLISDVLENYWRAHLGAKALLMGFVDGEEVPVAGAKPTEKQLGKKDRR